MILRSYDSVFPHAAVWYGLGLDLLLVGMPDPASALDLERILRRLERPDIAAQLSRCGVPSAPAFLAHELWPMGVLHAAALTGPLHTLLFPRLSALAGRAFFVGGEAELPATAEAAPAAVGERNSLLRRFVARQGGQLGEDLRAVGVRETCTHRPKECLAMLAEWTHEVPDSPRRERILRWIGGNPILSRLVPLSLLEPLTAFHATQGPAAGPLPVEEARRGAELFARYYHHAAPFPREALERLWRRCESDLAQAHRCAEARDRSAREARRGGSGQP
jgi:hypothetical protein